MFERLIQAQTPNTVVKKGQFVMKEFVKAFFALALVAGLSVTASAQVAKSTGRPQQQPPGTVILGQPSNPQPSQSTPVYYPPQTTTIPAQYPNQASQPVYTGPNASQVQQIDQQLAQLHQQEEALRQQERALRQQRAQLTGQQPRAAKHDNGKHKGWYKNGKANGARDNQGDNDND
jgi:hypothetical protein